MELLQQLDQQLLLAINSWHTPLLDQCVWNYTGQQPLLWLPLLAFLIFMIARDKQRDAIIIIVAITLTILLSDQLTHLLKHLIARPRPTHTDLLPQLHIVNQYLGGQYGHPSSHAANAFALALFTTLLFRQPLYTATIYTIATTFALTRTYLAVHYPSDLLAGALIGTLIALLIYYLTNLLLRYLHRRYPHATTNTQEKPRCTATGFRITNIYVFVAMYVTTLLINLLISL